MTVRLYHRDPYLFEFEATVVRSEGDWLVLDGTAFYPGGGGQAADRGRIQGLDVAEVEERGDEVWHRVPGHNLREGLMAWCSVDWQHRYEVMRGHTAEHMLFSALSRADPDLELVKIGIDEGLKRLTVKGEVDWGIALQAQREVNRGIAANIEVCRSAMERDEAEEEGVRAKLDRIGGDTVDVVEIGDFDRAACAGIHVMETAELGAVLITRIGSGGGGEVNIDFEVGEKAMERSLDLANLSLSLADELGCPVENLAATVRNARAELERGRAALRELSRLALGALEPREVAGLQVHAGAFPYLDKKEMREAAERVRNAGGVAFLLSTAEKADVVLAAADGSGVDCLRLLDSCLRPLGGSGGGRPGFAQGGLPDPSLAQELLGCLLSSLRP